MIPTRPLRGPTRNNVLQAYGSVTYADAPDALVDFMATIGPTIGDPFIVRTIAVAVADICGMQPPERKIEHLDRLLGDVNFPPEVAREINRVTDRVVVPSEFVDLAAKLVPPMHNLTGAVLEPPFPVPEGARLQVETSSTARLVYDEIITSFQSLHDDLVRHISYGLLIYSVAPSPTREEVAQNASERIPERLALLDLAAGVCGMTLHHPETWPEGTNRMQLMTMLNEAKARDAAVQEYLDSGETITPVRNLMAIIDDLVIDYCQRAIRTRNRDLMPVAFWRQVLKNGPMGSGFAAE